MDGLVIAQLGGESEGAIVAYDLTTGNEKWKWTDDGTAYASPVLLSSGDIKAVIAETSSQVVALNLSDGKLLWSTSFPLKGRSYNSSTPMVDGQTVIFSGSNRGTKAVKLEKKDNALTGKELWNNEKIAALYNTPIIRDGKVLA